MAVQSFAHQSEKRFAQYLDANGLKYEREVLVSPGNIDFLVRRETDVLCEVKAVEQAPEMQGREEAHKQIREDLKRLRQKFAQPPTLPCVLVTMNYSPQIFTGLSVRKAMLGDVGVTFTIGEHGIEASSAAHHLAKGNAQLTTTKNTSLSGVLVINCAFNQHCFFENPYASVPVPDGFFPQVTIIAVQKDDDANAIIDDSNVQFFPHNLGKA